MIIILELVLRTATFWEEISWQNKSILRTSKCVLYIGPVKLLMWTSNISLHTLYILAHRPQNSKIQIHTLKNSWGSYDEGLNRIGWLASRVKNGLLWKRSNCVETLQMTRNLQKPRMARQDYVTRLRMMWKTGVFASFLRYWMLHNM